MITRFGCLIRRIYMSIDQRGRGVPVIRVGGTEVSAIRRRHNLVKGGAISILGALALIVLPGAAPATAVSDALALAMTRPQEQIGARHIAPEHPPDLPQHPHAFYALR